jgi:hypothetical protein
MYVLWLLVSVILLHPLSSLLFLRYIHFLHVLSTIQSGFHFIYVRCLHVWASRSIHVIHSIAFSDGTSCTSISCALSRFVYMKVKYRQTAWKWGMQLTEFPVPNLVSITSRRLFFHIQFCIILVTPPHHVEAQDFKVYGGDMNFIHFPIPQGNKHKQLILANSVAQEPEGSSPHSQQPATGPCPEPVESNPHPPSQSPSLRSILIPSSHLHLGLPSGLFPSGFPTKTLYTFLSYPSFSPWLDLLNDIWGWVQIMKFLHSPVTSSKYSSQNPALSSRNMRHQDSLTPIQNDWCIF